MTKINKLFENWDMYTGITFIKPMKIKADEGSHLTEIDKRNIKIIFKKKLFSAKINRKNICIIKLENNQYKYITIMNEANDWGQIRPVKHVTYFSVN